MCLKLKDLFLSVISIFSMKMFAILPRATRYILKSYWWMSDMLKCTRGYVPICTDMGYICLEQSIKSKISVFLIYLYNGSFSSTFDYHLWSDSQVLGNSLKGIWTEYYAAKFKYLCQVNCESVKSSLKLILCLWEIYKLGIL